MNIKVSKKETPVPWQQALLATSISKGKEGRKEERKEGRKEGGKKERKKDNCGAFYLSFFDILAVAFLCCRQGQRLEEGVR